MMVIFYFYLGLVLMWIDVLRMNDYMDEDLKLVVNKGWRLDDINIFF